MKIYLQKEEDVFEKYGDEEAELYNQMIKIDAEKKAAQRKEKEEKRAQ